MDIRQLASQFRNAIDIARDAGEFNEDISFYKFPRGCCGDTCHLLAQFLLESGIRTYYVCGWYIDGGIENNQSHAWLLTDNKIIIDITGDQFKYNIDLLNYDKSVHVGPKGDFHRLFQVEDRQVYENTGLDSLSSICQPRLKELYQKITKYI